MMDVSPAVVVLLVLMAIAAVSDARRGRIPNAITYPGILLAMALHGVSDGWSGLELAAKGFLFCGGLMMICFVLFGIGGGDVKLVAMMGAFLGSQRGIEALLWTFLIGSVVAVAVIVWRHGIGRILSGAIEHAKIVIRSKGWVPLTAAERAPLQRSLYLAPSALAAVCWVLADEKWRLYSPG